ncbi:biotin-dependent carboxyltransferase family protein [Caminibacter mediatlanticus TB-2]|uniref:Allophanate hydrolase subunit 2 n=1 Tax=Caminibacter mediatlanticus TB-2 TaxID=391592 RepID=A0AAI9AH61_9BACT|nr:biotin-dependent carboxyltransferase family protein [Caminibacter mediatlanticus]EDM23429.1 Allophanate hydrolase subunit 2 [Caminibacter mediatlanticus TB-2]QCT94002.1 biotin-dependent carboxyltransferase family protein [Caminibacter mediatlanticus TB-2]
MIKIIEAGFLSTIQDLGRYGFTDIGLSHSGAMDEFSYLLANALLGDKQKPCIEISTYSKFSFQTYTDISISICGIEALVLINENEYNINRTFKLKKGDIVTIKPLKGNFIYICFKNGIKCEKKYGSYSVSIREKILSPLKNGDEIKLQKPQIIPNRYFKQNIIINQALVLRVILGYQKDYFHINDFFNQEYELKTLNRQGAILSGKIQAKQYDIVSEGISFGAIQIPPNGNLIVLLKEHQTIGGYPKIGNVLPLDCFKLSQLKRGKVIFKEISLEEAKKEMTDFYRFFNTLLINYKNTN